MAGQTEEGRHLKVRPQAIFSFVFLIFFIVFVYQAQDWRLQARLYPWAIGIPMIILALIQVILDLKGVERKQQDEAPVMDYQFSQTVEPKLARRRAITMFSWLFGFFVGIWLIGFSITIPLMVFSYLKIQSNEKWAISIILTVLAWLFFYFLFVKLLTLPFPEGLIFTWLGY
jgi:Tripartite tricarboxylate transporter TctB family